MKTDPWLTVTGAEYFMPDDLNQTGDCILRYRHSDHGPGWLLFRDPVEILQTSNLDQVPPTLEAVMSCLSQGSFVVGFCSYEAGSAFEPKVPFRQPKREPLAWFAAFPSPPAFFKELPPLYEPIDLMDLVPELTPKNWRDQFADVEDELERGTVYQVNLSYRVGFRVDSSGFDLFRSRCGVIPPRYATYINGGPWEIVSLSPELLFKQESDRVTCAPMKGTAPAESGLRVARGMSSDPKTIAENLIITDMVRNDLGAFARLDRFQFPNSSRSSLIERYSK